MKRLLIVIPLLALAVGLALFLRPRGVPETTGPSVPAKPDAPGAPALAPPSAPAAERPSASPTARTGSLHLLVQSQGKGLPNTSVKVMPEDGRGGRFVQTDDQGFQTIDQMPVGEYVLSVNAPRHVSAAMHAEIRPGQVTELTIPLSLGSRLQGRVLDPRGRPVAGASLHLMNPPKGVFMNPTLAADSDAEGRFAIDGVPLLDLDLHAYHARYKPWIKKDLPFRNPDIVLQEDVVLQEGASVSGRVVNAQGLPVAGALVIANSGVPRGENTDPEGRFVVYGLADAPLTLTVKANGYGTQNRQGVPPGGAPLEIRLQAAARLDGVVESVPPPDPFQILLYQFDPSQGKEARIDVRVYSGTRGAFDLPDLEPGTYRLEAVAQGYDAVDTPQVLVQEGSANPPIRIKMLRKK